MFKNIDLGRVASGWLKFLTGKALGPWVPLQPNAASALLKFGKLRPGETAFDLGCGDGRVVIAAAREFGARGVGIEMDASLLAECRAGARAAGVEDKVQFIAGDALRADISAADLVTMYLSVPGNSALYPLLRQQLQAKPLTRVVTFQFPIEEMEPVTIASFSGVPMHLYTGESVDKGKCKS